MTNLEKDIVRYGGKVPAFLKWFRKIQATKNPVLKKVYRMLFKKAKEKNHIEIDYRTKIGGGLYIGHPYCITINVDSIIGENVNIHKGVTIGQENRGSRKGSPTIGSNVWIGINSTIVGKITIGDNVLIAPNSYVNCDVPSNSIVIGNPARIIHSDNATDGYVNRKA